MDTASALTVIAGVWLGTFAVRVLPFAIGKRFHFPPLFLEWLILVSLGITAGLVSKNLFVTGARLNADDLVPNFSAVILAALLQRAFSNVLLSLFSAVATATAIKYLLI